MVKPLPAEDLGEEVEEPRSDGLALSPNQILLTYPDDYLLRTLREWADEYGLKLEDVMKAAAYSELIRIKTCYVVGERLGVDPGAPNPIKKIKLSSEEIAQLPAHIRRKLKPISLPSASVRVGGSDWSPRVHVYVFAADQSGAGICSKIGLATDIAE